MKSVYHHHRAGSLWSQGRSSDNPAVIEDCAAQLERYNYHEHAAILRAKLPAVEPEPVQATPSELEQVDVKVVVAPKRSRKKKGG